jgi:hypothetical protein
MNPQTESTRDVEDSRSAAERLMQMEEFSTAEVVDDNGDARELHTLRSGDQILFRGRDDAYLPPIQSERAPSVLTVDEEAHTTTSFEAPSLSQPERQGTNLFIANATPLGVIDLAITLRDQDTPTDELMELRENIKNRAFGQKEEALLDLMAAAIYGSSPSGKPGAPELGGLIDVALALNGDPDKTKFLHEKLSNLAEIEHNVTINELGELALEKMLTHEKIVSPEALELAKGMVLVRTTSFEPEFCEDSSVCVQSASDYTHEIKHSGEGYAFIPRETVHFSLNHLVESHTGGDFRGRQYTIISRLDKVLEANGAPARTSDVDTYFITGPNGKIALPDSIIVSPDERQTGVVRRDGNIVTFKSKGFAESDTSNIISAFVNGDFPGQADQDTTAYSADRLLRNKLLRFAEKEAMFINESDSSMVRLAVEQGDLPSWRLAPPLERDKAQQMSFQELTSYIALRGLVDGQPVGFDLPLSSLLSTVTVEGAITEQGGEVVQGGNHYTSSQALQDSVRALSDKLEVAGGLHSGSPEERAEGVALQQLYGQDERRPHTTNMNQVLNNPDISHKIRRSIIANGLLVASGKNAPAEKEGWSGV